jgi:hypothetical protein
MPCLMSLPDNLSFGNKLERFVFNGMLNFNPINPKPMKVNRMRLSSPPPPYFSAVKFGEIKGDQPPKSSSGSQAKDVAGELADLSKVITETTKQIEKVVKEIGERKQQK